MPIQEIIKVGKKFRQCVSDGIWERLSLWHKASDCEMENGNNLEEEIRGIKDYKNNLLVYNEDSGFYQGYANGKWQDVVDSTIANNAPLYIVKDGEINNDIGFTLISHIGYATQMGKKNGCFYISVSADEKKSSTTKIQTVKEVDLTQYSNFHLRADETWNSSRGQSSIYLFKNACYNKWEKNIKGVKGNGEKIYHYLLQKSDFKHEINILYGAETITNISDLIGKYYIAIELSAMFDGTEGVYGGERTIKIMDMWFD